MMANDTYTANADGSCYVGKFNLPLWVRSMTVGAWSEMPTSNTLVDLNPRNNPALNPVFPNKPEWEALGSFNAIVTAWCGGCSNGKKFWIPLSAGHADYAGGEPYELDYSLDLPAWSMMHPPTGALPDVVVTNDSQEATGLYANGRPRAVHTYNKTVYIPEYGFAVIPQGSTSWSGQAGTRRAIIFDEGTGEMSRFGAELPVSVISSGLGACYDSSRGAVWVRGVGTGAFHRYIVATDTWETNVTPTRAMTGYNGLTYIPEHDCIFWVNSFLTNGFAVLDCATGVTHEPSFTGSLVGVSLTGGCQPHQFNGNNFAVWDNSTNTQAINVLTFTSNPRTDTWSISQLPVASGSVTPTAKTANGTYGRFFHSPEYGFFGLLNAVNQSVYVYRYK